MAALLIYSTKCQHSEKVIEFVNQHDTLKKIVNLHDIGQRGVPPQYKNKINRVPTLLTKNGKLLVGDEIKQWLYSLLPNEIESCGIGGMCSMSTLEKDESGGDFFSLNNYGQSLQPMMTTDLENKINKKVSDAFDSASR